MWEIVRFSIKSVYDNMGFVLLLFFSSIAVKYCPIAKTVPFTGVMGLIKAAILILFTLFIIGATLNSIYIYGTGGLWSWKNYAVKGFQCLPITALWLLVLYSALRAAAYGVMTMGIDSGRIMLIALGITGFIISVIPAALVCGKGFKEAFAIQRQLLSGSIVLWLGSGLYIVLLIFLGHIIVYMFWMNALAVRNIFGLLLVAGSELIRSATIVVILSTLAGLVFMSGKYKKQSV